ncbi:MAG TPA: BadF/BadG/BcrA/BcrD ATPase family protein [Streptosporangiaceae bacterium]
MRDVTTTGQAILGRAERPLYGIDAGGSGTSACAWDGARWTVPSLNPAAVGQHASDQNLADLFGRIREHLSRDGEPASRGLTRPAIWLASASVSPATAAEEKSRCAAAAQAAGLRAELVLSNDVTPLLLSAPPDVGHAVIVCGTGSQVLATDGRCAPVRVGGCECLGSDEGSAFDLGLFGLRAAVRGLDGRGQPTVLSDLLATEAGEPVPELARRLARTPFPKAVVAALAPIVLRAWLSGDQVAKGLVNAMIGELVLAVRAGRDRAGITADWRVSVVGGVMTGCPPLFSKLVHAVASLGADPVTLVSDPAAILVTAMAPLAVTDPLRLADPRIDGDAWYLDLAAIPTERAN